MLPDVLRSNPINWEKLDWFYRLHQDAGHHPICRFHSSGFVIDSLHATVDLWWGRYEYVIHLEELNDPVAFLDFLAHVSEKDWEGCTGYRMSLFIRAIVNRNGWRKTAFSIPTKEQREQERSVMTPQLRMAVMERDRFRCQICGISPAEGAMLHLDHVLPVSMGGRSTYENLQVLCASCNFGKRTGRVM